MPLLSSEVGDQDEAQLLGEEEEEVSHLDTDVGGRGEEG